jgi:hypothetical protein
LIHPPRDFTGPTPSAVPRPRARRNPKLGASGDPASPIKPANACPRSFPCQFTQITRENFLVHPGDFPGFPYLMRNDIATKLFP